MTPMYMPKRKYRLNGKITILCSASVAISRPRFHQFAPLRQGVAALVRGLDLVAASMRQRRFGEPVLERRSFLHPVAECAAESVRHDSAVALLGIDPHRQPSFHPRLVHAPDRFSQ